MADASPERQQPVHRRSPRGVLRALGHIILKNG
jgi:hypothetical protein